MKELDKMLLKVNNRAGADRIVKWTGHSQARFDLLFEFFSGDEPASAQRAAWPIAYCAERYPGFMDKHLDSLFQLLRKPSQFRGVKRSTLRMLQFAKLPEHWQGELMNLCFQYIGDLQEEAAVKAFALGILGKLSGEYPEISNELKTVIRSQWDYETPAFRSRALKILSGRNRKIRLPD